jgi:hypothetical protein
MAKQTIFIGQTANDRTGDPLRTAFVKVNSNFDELYARTGDDIQIPALAGNTGKVLTTNGTTLSWTIDSTTTSQLVNGNKTVSLGTDGNLTFPRNGTIDNYLDTNSNQSIELTPNNLSQTTATIIVDKNGPPNAQWATVQVGWTITIGLVTRTINSITEDLTTVSFVLNGTVALPMTGSVIFQSLGMPLLAITPDGTTAWTFGSDGTLTLPSGATQTSTGSINCQPGVDTIVFTSSQVGIQTIKLLLQVEGTVTTGDADTQSCEMIVAKGFRGPTVVASVYGIVYTSVEPLATFTADWNPTLLRVEVMCQPTSLTNSIAVKAFATEITTSD